MEKPTLALNLADRIASLRKKQGLTQEQLAKLLFVSNRTVSKWERRAGYPEITQLVRLSQTLGVSIDQLINGERYGITIAGNMLTDFVKVTDGYPREGMLSTILSLSKAVGGCAPNTAIDLAVIDRTLPISVCGKVGNDENGAYITMELRKHGIDVGGISYSDTASTSFSDVMSVASTGNRTFFHHRGANAEFSPADVNISTLTCKMLHIGYILLLDEFDRPHAEEGTVMAAFLKAVQEAGITTSIDVVSSDGGDFAQKITPALRYTDNAILNEIEACCIFGLSPRYPDGTPHQENIRSAMERIMACGVGARVIVHCPEAGFCLNKNGEWTVVPSLLLPEGYIKGGVGAGDAFCAGCLYGIYHGFSDCELLEFASGAAACNLAAEDSVSGMRPRDEIFEMLRRFKRRTLPTTKPEGELS